MGWIFLKLFRHLFFAVAFVGVAYGQTPQVNITAKYQQANWTDNAKRGSCVYASAVTELRWMWQLDMAEQLASHSGPCNPWKLMAIFDDLHIDYVATVSGQVEQLEWDVMTRRGAIIGLDLDCKPGQHHCVVLVHLDGERAAVVDPNYVGQFRWMTRKQFVSLWLQSGGWAITPLFSPAPPQP